jgi:hypothetical protein
MKDEALNLALEALSNQIVWFSRDTMIGKSMRQKTETAMIAIKEALAQPKGQAPCARHCESTAYEIVIRGLKGDIERLKVAQPEPPPWWAAVEKILEEYGLQAIDFVADFKAAMKDAAKQEPVAWMDAARPTC